MDWNSTHHPQQHLSPQELQQASQSMQYCQAAWYFMLFVTAMYAFTWDVIMDWGLLEPESRNLFLRDDLVYERHSVST